MSSEREATLAKIECKLQAIDSKAYLDLDCSKRKLFKRALHVFRLSYFGSVFLLVGLLCTFIATHDVFPDTNS